MKVKKIMLITFVLLAILAIGTVSASDDADFNEALTTDNVDEVSLDASADDELIFESGGDELAAISQDDVISDVSDEIVASSDSDVISNWTTGNSTVVISNVTNSSFAGNTSDVDFGDEYELINLIEDTNAHDTLVLDKDYIFTGPLHDDSSIGISIYKPMTIDGKGHTIDANNYCTIFAIDSPNIVLVNINFRNGHVSDDYSGGVLGGGNSNLAIVNCSFENNMATDTPNAGAIAMMGDNITISNSVFVNNIGYGMGGAITIRGNDITISDCVFRNNCVNSEDESETRGGAIYIDGENGNILNCVFNNNSADLGSDIYIEGISETFMIDDCISDAGESSIYFDDGSGDNHVDIIIFIDEEENFPLTGEDVDDGFVAISIPSDMEAYVLINSGENVFFNMSFYFFNPNKIGPEDDREDYTRYVVSPQDVIFFEGLSDEDEIEIGVYDYGDNKLESKTYRVFFEGDTIRFEGVGGEDDDEDEWTGPSIIVDTQKNYSIPDDSDYEFITVYAQNGEEYHVVIFSSSKMFFDKNLTDFENKVPVENDPELEGYYKYIITPRDVDFFNGIDELDRICIGVYKIEDDYTWIDAGPEYYKVFFNGNSSFSLLNVIDIRMFYGNFTSGETAEGMVSFTTEKFISIGIPESADVNEMNITVDYGSETRTYSLADFNIEESDPEDEEFEGTYYYMNLTDDIKELIRQNENKTITFNFTYDFKGKTISASFKRVLMGEIFYQIVSISDLYNLFDFKIADDVLVNSDDEAVRLFCFDDNWHVAHNDWGGGYFKVYVDNTMIKSYELHEDLVNGAVTGYISLSLEDLGISEGGVYNIRITHLPNPGIDIYEDEVTGELITRPSYIWVGETELMNKNITADFGYTEENSTIEISDIEFDYGETGSAEVTLGGASNITANVEGYDGANVTFNNGILTVSGLNAGNYTLIITTVPDEGYAAVSKSVNIKVNKINSSLTVTVSNITFGDVAVVNIEMDEMINGVIVLSIANRNYTVNVVNGKAGLNVNGLNVGTYEVTAVFAGNDNYESVTETTTVSVVPAVSDLVVSVADISVGDVAVVIVEMDEAITGEITISIANVNYTVNVVNGKGDLNVTGLNAGIYQVIAVFAGNDNFNSVMNTTSFSVSKLEPTIEINSGEAIEGSDLEVTVNMNDDATGIVVVNGESVGLVGGQAQTVINNLTAGNLTIVVTYYGDEKYLSASSSINVTVIPKQNPDLTVSVANINVGEVAVVNIEINAGATGKVIVDGNEVEITNGKATFNITGLAAGNHTITVVYPGDKYFNAGEVTTAITVEEIFVPVDSPLTVTVSNITFGDVAVVIVEMDEMINDVIVLSIANVNYTVNVVNGKGDLNVTGLNAGIYQVIAVFAGNDNFNSVMNTTSFTVSKLEPTIEINSGEAIEGSDLEVTVNMNDDATGIVVVNGESVGLVGGQAQTVIKNLTAGNLTIVVTYYGDEKYLSASSSINVTVIPKQNPELKVSAENIAFGETAVVNIEIDANVTGKVTISGNDVIISNGKGTYNISGLSAGNHTVTVVFAGDKYFNADEKTVMITVNEVIPEIIPVDPQLTIAPIADAVEGSDVTLVVSANDTFTGAVKVFVGENEVAIINMVDGKGSAAIAADKLTVGANTVKVTSEASEHFLAGEDTKTFTVTLSKTVTKDTFNKYFDANGVYIADLDEIVFSGEFTGIPKITISKAVSITGQDAVFADTLFNINADNVVISYLTINTGLTDYAVTLSGASQVSLINNNLNAINGILISDCANFTIDSNNIISTAGENINGIYINGTGSGVVRNNNLDLKSTKTAYAINTNPTGPLRVSYINNTIVAESYFAVGIYDDAELIKDNDILLKGNYAIGIAVLSEATVEGNGITLTTTNTGDVDDIDEPLGVETTGIKVNNDATITNNNVDSTGKSMSVVGGSSTISDNTLNGQVSIASNDNTIINNVITTTEDSAIDASSATGNTITSNEAYSSQGNGDDAIKAGEGNTVEGNFEKFDPALTISIADITEGADAVIVITTNNSFTGPVSVQIIGHSNITVDVTNGTGSLPVSGLGVGTYDAVATFKTTDIFTESIKNTTFTVKAKVATAVSAAAVTTTYATSKNIVVTLKDANGNPLAGKDVTITLNGASKTIKTDSKGQVSYAIGTKLAPNKYDATVKFAGDSNYVASTGAVKVTVKKATPKMTAKKKTFYAKKKTKKYTITLKTDKGKAMNKVKVTLKVKGKKYTATVKKGKATFNLKKLTKKGKHTATITFAGNKYYNKVTKKVKITVKK